MIGGPSPAKLAARLSALAQDWVADSSAARADRVQRRLLAAIGEAEPATLNEVASSVGRGAPAVSRSVDTLVRAGLVERTQDPDNRRRLALRLSKSGRARLAEVPKDDALTKQFGRFAASELRAIERTLEIFERGH
ncbi:MAG: MarR family transcriptional regulator [Sphingomicrobium sp.]